MKNTIKLISEHVRNGVVPLSVVKEKNYPLFKYILNNYRLILKELKNEGIYLLNNLKTLNNIVKIKYYLLYYYGEKVNMGLLRKADPTVYNYLSRRGDPGDVVEGLGFEAVYIRKSTEQYIINELYRLADPDGNIFKLSDNLLYSKIYYRAKKLGVSPKEYMAYLGFKYKEIDLEKVKELREKNVSFSEVSRILKVPRSTLHRIYIQEVVNKDGKIQGNVRQRRDSSKHRNN